MSRLSPGNDNPANQVQQYSWDAAWEQREQESQPEPSGADTEEFTQATAHTGDQSIMFRASQWLSSFRHSRLLFVQCLHYEYEKMG